jgi:hypothetical protein
LYLGDGWHAEARASRGIRSPGQLVECDRHPPGHRFLDGVLLGSSQGGVLAMAVEAVARMIVQYNSPASLPARLRRS